jgi:crotonobetainyl-CoA:carnitine CoA-transferase CaiB-like acyl-CoA transferase
MPTPQAEPLEAKPLAGLRVLDLGRMFAAPWAGQMLADLGADVIKVEQPRGDEMRHYGPPFLTTPAGEELLESTYSAACNRNKRSLAADLKTEEGRRTVAALAARADVVIENFKVGTLERFGLDYATVRAGNPGVIFCSVTGFGQSGPYASQPGVDTMFQALSGMMTLTGEPDGEPQRIGMIVVDLVTGLYAAIAVLAALQERHRSGQGQHIDLALFDCAFSIMSHRAMEYLMAGIEPMRRGSSSSGNVPGKNFRCREGTLTVQAGAEDQFRKLCDALGRPELPSDPRFADRRARAAHEREIMAILDGIFLTRTAADWFETLLAAGVYCAPLNTVSQGFADPQARHRGVVEETLHPAAGPLKLIANPIRYSRTPIAGHRAPPQVGEHTAEILAALARDGGVPAGW